MKKTLSILFILLLALSIGVTGYADVIHILYNNAPLNISPAPVVIQDRTLIPVRSLMEAFGAKVDWFPVTRSVIIQLNDRNIDLRIDSRDAYVNGIKFQLDVPAQIIDSRTYVPLRFVSDALGYGVQWDPTTDTVSISSAPPSQPTGIRLGATKAQVIAAYGEPDRIDPSPFGFQWYVYNKDYATFIQIGMLKDVVIAKYGLNIKDVTGGLITSNMSRAEVASVFGLPARTAATAAKSANQDSYRYGDYQYTCYFNSSKSNTLYAVSVVKADLQRNSSTTTSTMITAFEKEVFDITNAFRVQNGLPALAASPSLFKSAKAYSTDMAKRDFFSHTSPEGGNLADRLGAYFKNYSMIGEILAKGQTDPQDALNGWINSPGHLAIILGNFDALGTGIAANSSGTLIYAQHFILKGSLK